MQRTQGKFASLFAIAAAGALIAGCASGTDTEATDTTTTNGEVNATETAPDGEAAPGAPAAGAPGAEEGERGAEGQPGEAGEPGAENGEAEPGAPGAAVGADSTTINTPNGEFVVQGVILEKYNELGGQTSPLGIPTTNEESAPNGGRYSTFEGGTIYWTSETGAHNVWGGILTAWENEGGAGGGLGYPTGDEQTVPGGWQQEFQNGTITYTDGQPQVETR